MRPPAPASGRRLRPSMPPSVCAPPSTSDLATPSRQAGPELEQNRSPMRRQVSPPPYHRPVEGRVSVALVGCGAWGRFILRDLISLGCEVSVVARSERSIANAQEGGASTVVAAIDE